MNKDNQRKQLSDEIARLRSQFYTLMRGRLVPTPKAIAVKQQIDTVENQLKALDREAAQRLALSKAPIDDILEVIAIPLLADVMNDIVSGVDATLRKHGVQETVFGTYIAQIRHAALKMVDTLDNADASLPKLLDVNDTLVDAVKKKLMSFIKQRLNIKK